MCGTLVASVLLSVALARSIMAQIPGIPALTDSTGSSTQVTDPLGRTTPRGTIGGFVRAVDRGDFVSAARYMQVTASQRQNTKALAGDLKTLMDRYFGQTLTSISHSPDGALDDGLPLDQEHVGPLTVGERKTDVVLIRVNDPQAGRIWLISTESLSQVPALMASAGGTFIERVMPQRLLSRRLFGLSLAHWLVLAAAVVIPFVLLAFAFSVLLFLAKQLVSGPAQRSELDAWYAGLRLPALVVLSILIQLSVLRVLGFPLTFRIIYARVALALAVVAVAWLVRRLLSLGFSRARNMLSGQQRTNTRSLLLLVERVLKAVVLVVAAFAILTALGVDTKTALAGLGIGGLAIALGAQKTVENFLGGVFLLSDKALAVGDTCTIANRTGTIEDITLRSIRLRTAEQSLLSIPAATLAQSSIENFASRGKILMQTHLHLRYGTTAEQLRRVIDGIRSQLQANPRIEATTSRIRLVDFGDRAVELELFAYALTSDYPEFLAVREELLLNVASVVEAAGSGFAQPTQFIYMDGKSSADTAVLASVTRDPVFHGDVRLAQSVPDGAADTKTTAR